jgi:hypothetical protein
MAIHMLFGRAPGFQLLNMWAFRAASGNRLPDLYAMPTGRPASDALRSTSRSEARYLAPLRFQKSRPFNGSLTMVNVELIGFCRTLADASYLFL